MPNDREYVERTTVSSTPLGRESVRETSRTPATRPSNAGWWVAALIAVAALVGLMLLFATQNREADLQAAREQGAAEASVAAASADAQRAAFEASRAAQSAVDSTARASQRAAEAAQVAANQTVQAAQTAGDAAQDAATVEPAPEPAPAE